MSDKKFLTYEEQIKLLKDKGLTISDDAKAIELLKEHSYFDLINGYKYPFKIPNGNYKSNASIDDIYALYCFDDELRYALLKRIMEVEIHIKSLLSYSFCERFGKDESQYLNANNYNYSNRLNQTGINKLIQMITDTLNDHESFSYMKHQHEKYGNIPLWVLVKALTFGTVSRMYSYQQAQIQTKISKEFVGVNENALASFLDLLTRFRNVCAHNERLFDYKYNKRGIADTEIHSKLKIPKKNGHYAKGKSDLFAVLIILKYLLSNDDFELLIDDIDAAIATLLRSTRQIQHQQLYKYMGFPENWRDIRDLGIT